MTAFCYVQFNDVSSWYKFLPGGEGVSSTEGDINGILWT